MKLTINQQGQESTSRQEEEQSMKQEENVLNKWEIGRTKMQIMTEMMELNH